MSRISFNLAIWHYSLFNNTYHAPYIRNCSIFLVLFVSRFSSSFTPSPSWIALACSDQHLGLWYEIHISRKRPTFSFWGAIHMRSWTARWVHLPICIQLDIFGHNWMSSSTFKLASLNSVGKTLFSALFSVKIFTYGSVSVGREKWSNFVKTFFCRFTVTILFDFFNFSQLFCRDFVLYILKIVLFWS